MSAVPLHSPRIAAQIAAQATVEELRQELCPCTVLAVHGHTPAFRSAHSVTYLSPIRDEEHPSFHIYKKAGVWRWSDNPVHKSGSVFDLIMILDDIANFSGAWSKAQYYYQLQLSGSYEVPDVTEPTHREYRFPTFAADSTELEHWLTEYQHDHPLMDERIVQRWELSADGLGTIYVPYYSGTQVVAHKEFRKNGQKLNPPGISMPLYGPPGWNESEEYLKSLTHIILCEGESDTWIADKVFGADHVLVLGIPTISAPPETLMDPIKQYLPGTHLILAFDGDDTGVRGVRSYIRYLAGISGVKISRIPISDGHDIGGMTIQELRGVYARLLPYSTEAPVTELDPPAYKSGNRTISDWVLKPETVYFGEDYIQAYGGKILPMGADVTISLTDMMNTTMLAKWCNKYGGQFFGNNADAQRIASDLRRRAILCLVARMTTRAGLHDGDFVVGLDSIGKHKWISIAPSINVEDYVHLPPAVSQDSLRDTLINMLDLHRPQVTHPMLAWLAAAPLRSIINPFPILLVSGASGSGKTTTTGILSYLFSGSRLTTNLSATTPYAVMSYFDCTNAFPVWFDEYRPGARQDALDQLNQLLRDTYTGQVSSRGNLSARGGVELLNTHTDTPIIVTGEDTFVEISHRERAICVNLPRSGGNAVALGRLEFCSPIARSYLTYLHKKGLTHGVELEWIKDQYRKHYPNFRDRPIHNLAVLQQGWNMLASYAESVLDLDIGEPVFNLAIDASDTRNLEDPVDVLLEWAWNVNPSQCMFVRWEEGTPFLCISTIELMRLARRDQPTTLPFSSHTALAQYIRDRYGATECRREHNGKYLRVQEFPAKRFPLVLTKDQLSKLSSYES